MIPYIFPKHVCGRHKPCNESRIRLNVIFGIIEPLLMLMLLLVLSMEMTEMSFEANLNKEL